MSFPKPLRIVIVGGVSGGLSVATRARRIDETASIIVLEKGQYVSHANPGVICSFPSVIESDTSLVQQTPAGLKSRYNIDVRVDSEVLAIDRSQHTIAVKQLDTGATYRLDYDKLVLSQGAEPFLPPVDGIDGPSVFTLYTVSDLENVRRYIGAHDCRTAVIIGAGIMGLKATETLYNLGLRVSIIEEDSHVLPLFDQDIAELLHTELRHRTVPLYLQTKVERIEQSDSTCDVILSDGTSVAGDIVIAATGLRARSSLAEEAGIVVGRHGVSVNLFMQTSDPDIYAIGDMVETEHRIAHEPQRLTLRGLATKQGRLAADHIFGKATSYRGNVGTFLIKVLNLTAGITGLSIKRLREFGYSPQWVTIHTPDHAGYYPTTHQLTLRVAFEQTTGRILGAQAVGRFGVDKRIDVLSTALQTNMSIFDLQHLELSYTPQYGSAKDPVNVVGSVGSNILIGDVEVVHPEELQDQLKYWQIVDVRPAVEYEHGHISAAVNMPLDSLRESMAALDGSRPIAVYSRVGYHGYLAYRILKQAGYTVANLDGGYKLIVEGGFKSVLADK